jgi:uncharacterized membrane protein YccC
VGIEFVFITATGVNFEHQTMHSAAVREKLHTQWHRYRAPIAFGLRVTVAAILGLLIAQLFALPLHGLWVVLTATVVTQLSVGGSLRVGFEYILGTLGGALYAGMVGVVFAPATLVAQSAVLALTVAPLAILATVNPSFRVAPFSGVLVLLIAGQLGESPAMSALTRLLEVALGGAIAVVVSFFVLPERAHRLVREAAAGVLDELAKDVPEICKAFFQKADAAELVTIQNRIGRAVAELQSVIEEFKRERPLSFASAPDPAPLPRTLLRLRHDFVMIGRAGAEPFAPHLAECLRPALDRLAVALVDCFRSCALALTSGRATVGLGTTQEELAACASEFAAIRDRDFAQLTPGQLEQLFTVGFALEQLRRNISDLERCVEEWGDEAPQAQATSR